MSDASSVEKRLQELLDIRDRELADLRQKIEKEERSRDWRWTMHRERPVDDYPDLPVPRLEMRVEQIYEGTWSAVDFVMLLVYRHHLGHIVYVPIEITRRTGGAIDNPPPSLDECNLPYRDGHHLKTNAKRLNLPAFFTCEGRAAPVEADDKLAS